VKRLGRILLYIAILIMAYWVLGKLDILPSLGSLFKPKRVLIDNTPVLVEEVKKLSQLVTITAFDEVVVQESKTNMRLINSPGTMIPLQTTGKLVLIGRGKVMAGINLAKLTAADCFVKGDSVSMRLPAAEVLNTIMNPSDFETFAETGTWTPEDVTAVKLKAKDKMIARALQQQILSKAAAKSQQVVERFLRLLGFNRVHVTGG
jgi:Protein of unknown function (DUF4230)